MPLTGAAMSVWAKSSRTSDDSMSLVKHLTDTVAVAGHVWDDWLPSAVRRQIAAALPGGEDDGRLLLSWLAGIHDIGKATPAFAIQAPALAQVMRGHGLTTRLLPLDRQRHQLRHELASFVILTRWLLGRGWSRRTCHTYAIVLGSHHGTPPSFEKLSFPRAHPEYLGAGPWVGVQVELLDHMTDLAGARDRVAAWSHAPLPPAVQVLLTAAVIVCDWIASDESLFPYTDPTPSEQRARVAWDVLDLPPPWRPLQPPAGVELFADRFALPPGALPRPVQLAAVDVAADLPGPALMIIEAVMGAGKTEAALAAAEVMAHRAGAGGVFVALPTMATSNAMLVRVRSWVERLPVEGDDSRLSMFLAHGKAALNREAASLWSARPGSLAPDDADEAGLAVAVAHSWLRGRRRGTLSSFVVGTIDQVLFAALKSKFLSLRHLALAGKVVVIDEVHAVDIYMGSYLQRALEWLGAYGTPTVLLSATLPAAQRRALLEAYDRGRAVAAGLQPPSPEVYENVAGDVGYPVISVSTGGAPQVVVSDAGTDPTAVVLQRLADDDEALVAALSVALADGGVVGVLRNTVSRAQATYDLLRSRLDAEVVLLHSRFVAVDRAEREDDLVARLGPTGHVEAQGRERPRTLVVVGTQVIEQSLDIDFDLLVTDLAPVDLVCQRMGRLHRHARGAAESQRPPGLRTARCLIAGVRDWQATPPLAVPGSDRVYDRSVLLRALAVLGPLLDRGSLTLPDDVAPLVQSAYGQEFPALDGWETTVAAAEDHHRRHEDDQRHRAGAWQIAPVPRHGPLLGWVDAGVGAVDDDSPRGQAQVRDSVDTLEVVVVQRVDGEVRVLEWATEHAGRSIATEGKPPDDVARAVATCTLRLPAQLSRGALGDAVTTALERSYFAGWQESGWLKGQIALVLDEHLTAELPGHRLSYSRDRGLVVTRTTEDLS